MDNLVKFRTVNENWQCRKKNGKTKIIGKIIFLSFFVFLSSYSYCSHAWTLVNPTATLGATTININALSDQLTCGGGPYWMDIEIRCVGGIPFDDLPTNLLNGGWVPQNNYPFFQSGQMFKPNCVIQAYPQVSIPFNVLCPGGTYQIRAREHLANGINNFGPWTAAMIVIIPGVNNPLNVQVLSAVTQICDGNCIDLNAQTTGCDDAATFLWSTGATTQNIQACTAGTYGVTVTNANGCTAVNQITIVNSEITVNKSALLGNLETANAYTFQGITYSVQICNNTATDLNLPVTDNLPSTFEITNNTSGLTYDAGLNQLTGTVFVTAGNCVTITYVGRYNVTGDEQTQCVPQDPNTVSVYNPFCDATVTDQSQVCISFGCPGHLSMLPIQAFPNHGIGNTTKVWYNQHKLYENVTELSYRIHYPDFLDILTTWDNDNFNPNILSSNPSIVITNENVPSQAGYKSADVYFSCTTPINIGVWPNLQVFNADFVVVDAIDNEPQNAYDLFVNSLSPLTPNMTDMTTNGVEIEVLTQIGMLEIIDDNPVNIPTAAFTVEVDPCKNKVWVTASEPGGLDRWEFNDPNNPFVPIWGGTVTEWQYMTSGTYTINHLHINEFGNMATSTQTITLTPVAFDYPSGMTITSPSQTITDLDNDGYIRVRGLVTIASGVTYQINNKTIEFADDLIPEFVDLPRTHSGIIVNRNSTLNLSNATLRSVSTCPTSMWQGIQVLGDEPVVIVAEPAEGNRQRGARLINSPLQNGKLNSTNSVIEEARIAIAAFKIGIAFGEQNEYGRGTINANNTTFKNNHVSVAFRGRNFVENNSVIKACTFQNTADLKDMERFPKQGIKNYVQLDQVKNVQILANAFYGRTSYAPEKRGNAIVSYDAAYTVSSANTSNQQGAAPTPNSFAHLTKGIDVYSTGGANKVVRVKNNSFNQVVQGITANGSNFDEISFNAFNVPLGSENLNSWGLNLFNSSGFLATQNTFNSSQANEFTYGLVARNTSLASGQAYKNNFAGKFFAATQAEQKNSKLQIKCNTYSGVNTYDWAITSGELANQGVCSPDATTPAGNIFGLCTTNDQSQIWKNPMVPEFAYRTHSNRVPNCVSSDVFIEGCNLLATDNSCPSIVSNPCPNCSRIAREQYDRTPPGLEKDRLRAEVIRLLAQEGNPQALVDFITQEGNMPEDIKILIPTHIENGDCAQARVLLNVFDRTTMEGDNFFKLYDVLTILCETGRRKREITVNEREVLKSVQASETYVNVHADALLAEVDELTKTRIPEKVAHIQQFMLTNNNGNTLEINEVAVNLSVYPNPSEEVVVVSNISKTNAVIIVSDALGRIHFNGNLNEANLYQLTLSLNKGMYVVKQITEDGKVSTQNILIQD